MAVRLQMKLGVVAEHDRLPDSPDTLVVVEPNVGSVARSKGLLYLLVTSRISSRHALEATRLAAETIRNEYYYDESAGIRVCLQKAIGTANKRLAHQADRLGLKSSDGNGPIGVAVAVVRANEMYVATVGPAEAYLIRQARLSTLPDPHRERGLPSGELEPEVWRGEVSVGDSLVLVSPNVMAKLGPDELKDAMLTLHPQSAMEHLHHRFVADGGAGSDGAIAFEAGEVSATARGRALVPVKPAEPLAGAPDRSPIPLADNVQAAGVAVSAAAGSARVAAGGALEKVVGPGPGAHAPPEAGLSPRDAAGLAPPDPAAGGARGPRATRRRGWPRLRGLRLRRPGQAGGDPLGQHGPGGAGQGQGEPRQGEGPRRRSRGRRRDPGEAAPDRDLQAARRCPGRERQRRGHRPVAEAGRGRPGPPVRRRPGGLDADLHLHAGRGRRPDRPRRHGQGSGWRTVRAGPLDEDGLPGRPQVQEGHGRGARRPEGERGDRRDAAVPRGGCFRPADPGLEEHALALASLERERQGHAHADQGERRRLVGRRRDRHRDLPAGPGTRSLQAVRRRPVRAADPVLRAGRRRRRLPDRLDPLARHGPCRSTG